MLRPVGMLAVGALLVAPLGFEASMPLVVSVLARMMFVMLGAGAVVLTALGMFWARRWPVGDRRPRIR